MKARWAPGRGPGPRARETAHRLWPNMALEGEVPRLLPLPRHLDEITALVTEDRMAARTPCGPDPEVHAKALQAYGDAGYDEVYVSRIGPDQGGLFDFYRDEVPPRAR